MNDNSQPLYNETGADKEEVRTTALGSNFNYKAFLGVLWAHKYWLLCSVLICTCIAVLVAYRTPPTYESSAELIILNSNTSGLSSNGLNNFIDMKGLSTGEVNMYNEMEMMKSPSLMTSVIKRLNLDVSYYEPAFGYDRDLYGQSPVIVNFLNMGADTTASFTVSKINNQSVRLSDFSLNDKEIGKTLIAPLGKIIETPVGRLSIGATSYYSSFTGDIIVKKANLTKLASTLSKRIVATTDEDGTTLVQLKTSSTSQQKAIDILNALMQAYDEMWILEKNRSTVNSSDFIKNRLAIIEKELSGIDENISQVKSSNAVTTFDAAAQNFYSQSSNYDTQEFEISTQLSIAKFLRDYLKNPQHANSPIPSNSGIESGAIETQIQEYNRMLIKRNTLLQNSSASNPIVAELNDNIAAMRQMIIQSVDNLITTTSYRAQSAGARGRMFSGKVSAMPEHEKQILSIERQQKVKENLYLYLLQKREENELSSMVTVNNTRLVRAAYGEGKVSPHLTKSAGIGALIGLLIPVLILYLLEIFDNKVNSQEDIKSLNAPFLGEIPSASRKRNRLRMKVVDKKKSRLKDDEQLKIVVRESSRNQINESFRMVRTNLDFMTDTSQSSQVIMVTSFNPGSGKTFISANLAKSLAIKGKKVIVVDIDLRRASLSKFINSPAQGVSTFLTGKTTDLHSLIYQPENETRFDIMPVGPMPPNPVELLLSKSFDELIADLRKEYDYIILDCPPVGIVADTTISTRVADLTIFVMRAGLFEKGLLSEVEEIYTEKKLPNMAIILNDVDMKKGSYGYRYGRSSSYNSSYYTDDEDSGTPDKTK